MVHSITISMIMIVLHKCLPIKNRRNMSGRKRNAKDAFNYMSSYHAAYRIHLTLNNLRI